MFKNYWIRTQWFLIQPLVWLINLVYHRKRPTRLYLLVNKFNCHPPHLREEVVTEILKLFYHPNRHAFSPVAIQYLTRKCPTLSITWDQKRNEVDVYTGVGLLTLQPDFCYMQFHLGDTLHENTQQYHQRTEQDARLLAQQLTEMSRLQNLNQAMILYFLVMLINRK